MTDKQIINQEEAIKMIKKLNEKLKNVDNYIIELRSNFYRMKQDLDRKEQECEKAKQNAQDIYDLWQALIESFNILQGEKIKLEQEREALKENLSDLKFQNDKISELELDLQNANSTIENIDLMRVGEYNALVDDYNKLKQTLAEIIRFFKEDEKFARYSGCPVVLTETALEEIKNILKENDIKINEVEDDFV